MSPPSRGRWHRTEGHRRWEIAVLVLVVAAAALLRFTAIDHHLARGAPDFDERQNFVDPILKMWRTHSPDPTVYAGYPGLFNWLAFLPVGIGDKLFGFTGAYVGARATVAAAGVLSTVLIYIVIRRGGAGAVPALFAAALMAVSRVEVRSAHHATPDVLVGTATVALLGLFTLAPNRKRDAGLGAVIGLAIAVKYTALLLAPAALAGLLVERRLRQGLPWTVLGGALAFALGAPYAVLRTNDQGLGLLTGLATYYGAGLATNQFVRGEGSSFLAVPGTLVASLGAAALVLAAGSLWGGWRKPLPAAAWTAVVTATVVMAPANLVNPRHVIPAAAATVALSAVGLDHLDRRSRVAASVAGLLCVALPAHEAVELVARYRRIPAVDHAALWLESQLPVPARIATSLRRIHLAPERIEVRYVDTLGEIGTAAFPHYDAVVAPSREEASTLRGLRLRAAFPSEDDDPERVLSILTPERPAVLAPIPTPVGTRASHEADTAARILDGDAATAWDAPSGASWIELRWLEPRPVARIEVEVGTDDRIWPQSLTLVGIHPGGLTTFLETEALRPTRPHRQLVGRPYGQVYVLGVPTTLEGVRIERTGDAPWAVAEVRVLSPGSH